MNSSLAWETDSWAQGEYSLSRNDGNSVSECSVLKIPWRNMPPDPPRKLVVLTCKASCGAKKILRPVLSDICQLL